MIVSTPHLDTQISTLSQQLRDLKIQRVIEKYRQLDDLIAQMGGHDIHLVLSGIDEIDTALLQRLPPTVEKKVLRFYNEQGMPNTLRLERGQLPAEKVPGSWDKIYNTLKSQLSDEINFYSPNLVCGDAVPDQETSTYRIDNHLFVYLDYEGLSKLPDSWIDLGLPVAYLP